MHSSSKQYCYKFKESNPLVGWDLPIIVEWLSEKWVSKWISENR